MLGYFAVIKWLMIMNIYNNDDLEVLCATAEQVWQEQMEKDQQNQNEDSWGMFSYGDAPPAIGGGVGVFCWFDSRDELLDFIVKTLPFCPPGPGSDNYIETAKSVNEIIEKIKNNQLSLELGREQLNQILLNYSQIEWFGQFKELCLGAQPYPQKVIESFRYPSNSNKKELNTAGINDFELVAFKEFLLMYGI